MVDQPYPFNHRELAAHHSLLQKMCPHQCLYAQPTLPWCAGTELTHVYLWFVLHVRIFTKVLLTPADLCYQVIFYLLPMLHNATFFICCLLFRPSASLFRSCNSFCNLINPLLAFV